MMMIQPALNLSNVRHSLRSWLLAMLLPLIAYPAGAQSDRWTASFDFQYGLSWPQGEYASVSPTGGNAGFAMKGRSFEITGKVLFGYHIGSFLSFAGAFHPVDGQAMVNSIAMANPGLQWGLGTEDWFAGALTTGIYASWWTRKLTFEAKAMIGMGGGTYPKTLMVASDGTNSIEYYVSADDVFTLGYGVGTMIRVRLFPRNSINLDLSYFRSKPDFDLVFESEQAEDFSASRIQEMQMLNLSVGIGFKLGR